MNLLAAIASFIKVVETGSIVGAAKTWGSVPRLSARPSTAWRNTLAFVYCTAPRAVWR